MPLLLQAHELEVGMRLAKPVTSDRRVLLPAGRTLNSADIDSLRRVYSRATICILDPVLDEIVPFQDVTRDQKVAQATQRKLLKTMSSVREKFASRMSLHGADLSGIHEAMALVTRYLNENPHAAAMIMRPGKEGSYLTEHPANVFYLSLVVGNAVRYFARHSSSSRRSSLNLAPLGLAALFMDVALWPLEDVFDHPGPLSQEERQIVLQHPNVGADALPPTIPPLVPQLVRRHHENFDGTGYPEGISGDEIPLFARILRVADAFDAATSRRAFSEAKSAPRTLWEMTMGPYAQLYDPIILKVFGGVVQPYPIGAKLRLACGRYAVVVRFGRTYSLLPEVIIAFDEDNKRLPKRRLEGPFKLETRPELQVVSFAGEDLSDVYGDGTWYTDVSVPHSADFETLFESAYP
jgi:HD-GYP domain-containing protein (c-di-GMP phosphodiesterase class II)